MQNWVKCEEIRGVKGDLEGREVVKMGDKKIWLLAN